MAKYARVDEAPLRSWLTLLGIIPLYGSIGFALTGEPLAKLFMK
jgi:hypothetical protein